MKKVSIFLIAAKPEFQYHLILMDRIAEVMKDASFASAKSGAEKDLRSTLDCFALSDNLLMYYYIGTYVTIQA